MWQSISKENNPEVYICGDEGRGTTGRKYWHETGKYGEEKLRRLGDEIDLMP